MELPKIPQILDDWDLDILNELIQYIDIESETFDFKKESNELVEHICAMANSRGGYLILGIEQIDSEDKKHIIRFEKIGFSYGKQDHITNVIGSAILNIEPTPIVNIKHVEEDDKSKFYTIIKIDNKISSKPYFVKSSDQCFIRINTSKIRASRSMILQLFSATVEQIKNIQNLRASVFVTKEELKKTLDHFRGITSHNHSKASRVDLMFLRNAINSANWFLIENNLLNSENYENFIFVLHTIELLNAKIDTFNASYNEDEKQLILQQISEHSSHTLPSDLAITDRFLSNVLSIVDEYLKKMS